MTSPAGPVGLPAEDVITAISVHADRAHDAVRRQGASADLAIEALETSALDTVDRARSFADSVDALVGWWFARARALSLQEPQDGGALPLGGGLLAADSEQELLAEALELRPERERTALLLRDAYDLPPAVVAAALGTDQDAAMHLLGRARLHLLPDVSDTDFPLHSGHGGVNEAAMARLSEKNPPTARDSEARRHTDHCSRCRAVLGAQGEARGLLAGLSIVALSDGDREHLLTAVRTRAEMVLPTQEEVARRQAVIADADDQPLPRRLFAPIPVIAALVLATAVGLFFGNVLSTDGGRTFFVRQDTIEVTAPPPQQVNVAPAPPIPSARPSTRAYILPPTMAPVPTAMLFLDPVTGPNGTLVTITGTGWMQDLPVALEYLTPDGLSTGTTGFATPDATGTFTTQLSLFDPSGQIGEHLVVATDGTSRAEAVFTAT